MARCQICGRKVRTSISGLVGHHHQKGERCEGAGFPPIEISDAFLRRRAAQLQSAYEHINDRLSQLKARRVNWIDPRIIANRARLATRVVKLNDRLRRVQTWPERYRRSMERQMTRFGYAYADPPPPYLLAREAGSHD